MFEIGDSSGANAVARAPRFTYSRPVLNWVFLFLVVSAVVTAAFNGTMPAVSTRGMESAKAAVDLALGLIGQMALWLGFMRVLQDGGLMSGIARALRPVMTRLFRDVPADHPAMGAMILNLSANILGLANAATPFGLKAMRELDRLNARPGVATNAMALFLTINTAGLAVLPLGAVAVRATLGSHDAAGIMIPSLLSTMTTTIVGVIMVKLLERRAAFAPERYPAAEAQERTAEVKGLDTAEKLASQTIGSSRAGLAVVAAVLLAIGVGLATTLAAEVRAKPAVEVLRGITSGWLLPVLMVSIALFGLARRVKVYESFIAGAKEGFQVAVTIIPFLVAILVAIGMFRASGAMDVLVRVLSPAGRLVGIPGEALPMVFIKPLSGSGALAVMTETMKTHGPDSLVGYMVSTMNGSSETTFYVLAVYFGSVGVRATRHTLAACLTADATGFVVAAWVCRLFFA